MTNPCQGHAAESARAEHMKEAERLADAYANTFFCEKSVTEILGARAALLAHIQRGAVPEGWQVVPEIASDVMQRTFLAQPGTHTEFTHTALQCADFDSRYAAMLAAAPPPDQFRDAAKMMAGPSAFLSGGARYKISNGTVRGLPRELNGRWVALVAADDDCHLAPAPAEVPMPKPVAYGFGNTAITGHTNRLMMVRIDIPGGDQYAGAFWLPLVLADEAHTYGVACRAAGEAAGYARGLRDAVRDADIEALRLYVRALCKAVDAATDFAGTVAGGASWWDDVWADHAAALDRARERISQAALRGEVKP